MFLGWMLSPIVLVGGVVIVGLIVAYAVATRRARAAGDPSPVVSVTLSVAAIYAVVSLLAAVVALVSTLLTPQVTLTVPVAQYWPLPLPGVTIEPGDATVVDGGFTHADLAVDGLSTAARTLWALGQFVGLLVPTAIAALIAVICFQLLRGAAFAPLVAHVAMITAVIVLVGGLASQLLCGVAGSMASNEALTIGGAQITGYPDDFDLWTALPQPTFMVSVDFWPFAAGLGFAALAAVFRYGSKLQRETEGLV